MSDSASPTNVVAEISDKQKAMAQICNERSYPITNSIQPIGFLFVVDRNLIVHKVSENVNILGRSVNDILGTSLLSLVSSEDVDTFKETVAYLYDKNTDVTSARLFLEWRRNDALPIRNFRAEGFAYRSGEGMCIESELPGNVNEIVGERATESRARNEIEMYAGGLEDFADLLAKWIQKIIGYDRVYCFRFDSKKNGIVLGEVCNEKFTSLREHRFPATDIPANLHEIYKRSRFRYLADRDCKLVPLVAATGESEPMDLSLSVIRRIAPSHLKYLANMNVQSTISFSIVIDNQLWGLLGGHHASPRRTAFRTIVEAQHLVELFASRVQALSEISDKKRLKLHLDQILSLTGGFEHVSCDLGEFVAQYSHPLMQFMTSDSVLWSEGDASGGGEGLSQAERSLLIDIAKENTKNQSIFGTDSLASLNPRFADIAKNASGILALVVDEGLLIWVRKEMLRECKWGGNPNDALHLDTDGKVGPRHSFATWVQQVHATSRPWHTTKFVAVSELLASLNRVKARHANRLLLQNQQLAQEIEERKRIELTLLATTESLRETNKQLDSFAYVASHDLQEPLRMVANYCQLLDKRYGTQLEGEARQYLTYAVDGAKRMHVLINAILEYSRLVAKPQFFEPIDLNDILAEVQEVMGGRIKESRAHIDYAALPSVRVDKIQVYQLFQNLIGNALKFAKKDVPSHIKITAIRDGTFWRISVKDNGIGIPLDLQKKVFEMFQRLNPRDYGGTGIGLTICQRIVVLHGGHIWCESSDNEGANFIFTLPSSDEGMS